MHFSLKKLLSDHAYVLSIFSLYSDFPLDTFFHFYPEFSCGKINIFFFFFSEVSLSFFLTYARYLWTRNERRRPTKMSTRDIILLLLFFSTQPDKWEF